jgi:type IV pilus assembly protein PilE
MKQRLRNGFTLIELMVTVAIVGILLAVAVPAYSDYVVRGRLSEAFTALGGAQLSAEQFWSNRPNGRTYVGFNEVNSFPANTAYFTYALSDASASSFTLTATGIGKMSGFVYTIDQNGNHATTGSPDGWGVNAACWVDHKGGACTN